MKKGPRSLETYRAKRDFTLTSEPSPDVRVRKRAGAPLTFMVHKHDATRLHYDVRLEIGGVLVSWAVPKGPSYDPAVKRLAVQTEDHPLAYATFEGRIPDDAYGGGDSIVWERGTYETVPPGQQAEQLEKGRLTVELRGEKLRGRWHLVRTHLRGGGGKPQWLLMKAKDETARAGYDVTAERPESVKTGRTATRGPVRKKAGARARTRSPAALLEKVWPPMLATLSEPSEVGDATHVYEVKYDGFRALAAVTGGKVALQSRRGNDLCGRFPALGEALGALRVGEAVLDGEIVALDKKGRSAFQLLQNWQTEKDVEQRFVAFDLLWLEGEDLRERPLEQRRELLESLLAGARGPLQASERFDLPLNKALAATRKKGLEGLIAKRRGSPYVGTRSADWLKIKTIAGQEVVILGYLPISNGKKEIGALLVGVNGPDGWRDVGKVGTGYTAKVRGELFRLLNKHRVKQSAAKDSPDRKGAVWVEPRHVANVTFTEWTSDGRLRHPVFQGLRDDKRPEQVVRERAVTRVKGSSPAPARGERRAPALRAAHTAKAREDDPPTPRAATPRRKAAAAPDADALLTSPERVLFPESGLTKRDVFDYYRTVAPLLVPALARRPIAVQQWPQGIHKPGFFRHGLSGTPAWAHTLTVEHEEKTLEHLDVDRPETLAWLANQSALTIHMWPSRAPRLDQPEFVVFDLDPGKQTQWEHVITLAQDLRELLGGYGLESHPKTSGKRGLHLLVPLAPGHTYAETSAFAGRVAAELAARHEELATTERSIGRRGGRLYVDAGQNAYGKTVVAPYSLRAKEGAPFSAPLAWGEVTKKLDPLRFTLKSARRRLDRVGDLFSPVLQGKQRLPELH